MYLKYTTRQCSICGKDFQSPYKTRKTCGMACGIIQRARSKTYSPEKAIAKFWSRVDRSAGDDGCWLWTAGNDGSFGYGRMRWNGADTNTHRISYEITHGPIPDGLCVLHSCDNPRCVNPAHLWLGTKQDNADDMNRKGRNNQPRGERHGLCKLTDAQVAEIRERYAAGGVFQNQLATEYGVTPRNIGLIVSRKNRRYPS